ncbi:stabilizer of axonemal microtubules 2 isoform X2 [Xyrauchen texanus]|uniref:stabilizer of axonemal microtubules 2 isoform X2 n=1 Tax=Xyrauchen texanus TaxID=154827 RepID=UPI002241B9C9|nr:stabilizer of axonemal microtubules 2 isoform X2 [Xyrauchen texanus]
MTRLCLCEMCSCGRHHCPHQPTALYAKGSQNNVLTEYTEKYPAYKGHIHPKTLKPQHVYKTHQDPMDGTTTFRADYIPYKVTRRPERLQVEYKQKPGEIDLGTTYKQDFNLYEVQPFVPSRPKERVHTMNVKLDTVPTYKDDFRQWEISRRELSKPDMTYHPPVAKFGNSTTFQDDFVTKGLVPRESYKPLNVGKLSDAPFENMTSNKLSYVQHPIDARYMKPPEEYKPSGHPFQDLTTHRQDFQGLPGQLPKSCKPEQLKVVSNIPFQSNTEFRDRFQQWPVSLPQVHKSMEYTSPTAHMELTTTSHTDYIKHQVQPFVAAKPFSLSTKSSGSFQGNTTMRDDFQPWVVQRQGMIRKQEEIRRSSGKMEDMTTFKAHFIQHELQPTLSFKPHNTRMRTDAPLENETMYRTEFTAKRISQCPASFESPPGFVFDNCDDRGHRFFRKLMSADRIENPKALALMA